MNKLIKIIFGSNKIIHVHKKAVKRHVFPLLVNAPERQKKNCFFKENLKNKSICWL